MINAYGPTEATVCARRPARAPDGTGHAPIGRPIMQHTRRMSLDSRLQPVPPGVAGELYLAGASSPGAIWTCPV